MDYVRKITYIDKYSNGVKYPNQGYVKTVISGEKGTHIIKLFDGGRECHYSDNNNGGREDIRIGYYIWEGNGDNKIIAAPICRREAAKELPEVFEFNPGDMAGISYAGTAGIVIVQGVNIYAADWSTGQCGDSICAVEWRENLKESRTQNTQNFECEVMYRNAKNATEDDTYQHAKKGTESYDRKHNKRCAMRDCNKSDTSIKDWKDLFKICDKTEKFKDGYIYDVVELGYEDLKYLPPACGKPYENSFLLHGLYDYGHIILAKHKCKRKNKVYIIGVPGISGGVHQSMAPMFGFEHFKIASINSDCHTPHRQRRAQAKSCGEAGRLSGAGCSMDNAGEGGGETMTGYWYRIFTDCTESGPTTPTYG